MSAALAFDDIVTLTGDRFGKFDVPCVFCSNIHNPRKKVLRVYRLDEGFATFTCVRCGEKGFVRSDKPAERQRKSRRQPIEPETDKDTVATARHLWGLRQRITSDTPPYRYLRDVRGYGGPIPATLGYLPPRKPRHQHAMIAAFATVDEREPGVLGALKTVAAVHLTFLKSDGSGKADCEPSKIIVGKGARGTPIVLAAPNDLLGLFVTEGIENALTLHEITGCGAWAAGSANRLPKLAAAVPDYIDCVTVAADPDDVGIKSADTLVSALLARGLTCERKILGCLSP
jgi:hypothetical protein